MKALKVILGNICLQIALLLLIVVAFSFRFPSDIALIVGSCWLAGIGWFLVVRRNLPMPRAGRIVLISNFGFCALFLFTVGFPGFVQPRSTCCANGCVNNLKQIESAVEQFALENHLTNGAPIHFPDDLTPYIKLNSEGKIPGCPRGGVYRISKVGDTPTCSLGTSVTPAHILP